MGAELSPKFLAARDSLPPELWSVFEQLVADYKFATFTRHGSGYVAYQILADLVKGGWTHSSAAGKEP
jgi:hypothetical protein